MLTHEAVRSKKLSCEICNKKFARRSHLTTHSIIHSNLKPFLCEYCKKPFSNSSNLLRHQKLHKEERQFTCVDCNKKFSQKIHLQKHMLHIHDVKDIQQKEKLKPIILSNTVIVAAIKN